MRLAAHTTDTPPRRCSVPTVHAVTLLVCGWGLFVEVAFTVTG